MGRRPAFTALKWLVAACLLLPVGVRAQGLTVTLLPAAVAFNLTNGSSSNTGSSGLSVTTAWTLLLPGQTISVYGYFGSSSAALAHTSPLNTYNIPSSRVQVSVNGGARVAFDQTIPFGAASGGRLLTSQLITLPTVTGNRTDALALTINLNNYMIAADTYTGTLRVRAQVTP